MKKVAFEDVPWLCHELNRLYCQTIGDFSQVHYWQAPDWQKDSAVNGVRSRLDNPDAHPSSSHESWLAEKLDAGWTYGPVKDPEKKEHPRCVPYEDLPEHEKAKDALFVAVVDALRGIIK